MRNRFIYLTPIIIFIIACKSEPLKVDVSNVDFQLEIIRVDQQYNSQASLAEISKKNDELIQKSEELYSYYTSEMLQVGRPDQDSTAAFILKFTQDSIMQLVQNGIDDTFGDFSDVTTGLIDMFRHLKYHIPNAILPKQVMTYNSTFTNGMLSTSEEIGIGLEMYIGEENEIVQQIPFPVYFKKRMNADYLLPDVAESWLTANVIEDQSGDSFLSNLIYFGKLYYVIKSMLPEMSDHKVLRYTEEELIWADLNEYNVWQHIVEQNWVYNTEMKVKMRYFKPAPTTVGVEGSPAMLGQFIGWKIINAYMDKNPELTIKELIAERNLTKILKAYKPNQK